MQVLIPIHSVITENVFFTEKKRNVILDGNFVKILYSTEHFEMNGLHLRTSLESSRNPGSGLTPSFENSTLFSEKTPKFVELFEPTLTHNLKQIELLCKIERDIIHHYMSLHSPHKNATYNLKSQLLSGTFRFSVENYENYVSGGGGFTTVGTRRNYALKISGIWETNFNVGITVKFILID